MQTIINTSFNYIREYINSNHTPEIYKTEAGKNYLQFMEKLKNLHEKKVEIVFSCENDFISVNEGKKKGKIKFIDEKIRFYEGRKTARFYYLDGGLFLGFFATLCPTKITILN